MKYRLSLLNLLTIMLLGCSPTPSREHVQQPENEIYKGPIIDMHLHAFADGNPLLGKVHPPTLRGETYEGVATGAEQKEETLELLRKHNKGDSG